MKETGLTARLDMALDIFWENQGIPHHEHYLIKKLNPWRDLDINPILKPAVLASTGQTIHLEAQAGQLVGLPDPKKQQTVKCRQIRLPDHELMKGRFYPLGLVSGLTGVFRENITPFRLVELTEDEAVINYNHPFAGIPAKIAVTILERSTRGSERGGSCVDWIEQALSGPGMQQRVQSDKATAFFPDNALARKDETPDERFYAQDRFVSHIDATASRHIGDIYSRLLPSSGRILDLMSSWTSHLPETFNAASVHGLGMNRNELEKNEMLSSVTVHDLNQQPALPFSENYFDAVICSLSVEYLTSPVDVFREAARVLKPGGIFAVTFSNRWFPQKTIQMWEHLHEFERVGLVLEYFFGSGCFKNMATRSIRGYPRPSDDRYADRLLHSDPVFMVKGEKK